MKIKKITFLTTIVFICLNTLFSQEALKSIEEEYYDFLSLSGVVERPTLGYRTLSDGVWAFNEIESYEENEDGTFTKVRIPGAESDEHIWKNNNLGTTYTLWSPASPAENWFTRGIKQSLTARIYGPEWFNSYNTAAPYGQNDGALWQGRGYNTALTAGLRLEGYGFELTFKPQVSFSQNMAFDTNPDVYPNPYSYTFYSNTAGNVVYLPIDLVQRYGDFAFWTFDWGDSEIRWTWHSLTFGFGTQNPWLGPAYLNPMLGSNNAGGYLKFDAGLRKTEVVIPFKQIFKSKKDSIYNSSSFLDDNLLFIPYTLLNMGHPPKKVYAIITQNVTDITFHKNIEFNFDKEYNYFPFNSDYFEIIKKTRMDVFEFYEDINLNKKMKSKL